MGQSSSTADPIPSSTIDSSVSACLPLDCMESDELRTEEHVANRLRSQTNSKRMGVKHEDVQRFFEAIDDSDLGILTGDAMLNEVPYFCNNSFQDKEEERSLPSPKMGGNVKTTKQQ